MKHYIISCALCLLSLNAVATSSWDGTASIWTSGSGTKADPYQIATAQNLAYLAQSVNAGTTYSGNYFVLTDDIDLNNYSWTPIGDNPNKFSGVIDGDNHSVIQLSVTRRDDKYNNGLFGVATNEIKNLNVSGYVRYGVICGGVVAVLSGNISNCSFTGVVESRYDSNIFRGAQRIGGVVGSCSGNISYCNNYANVVGSNSGYICMSGGIAGFCNGTISNCNNYGGVSGSILGDYIDCYAGGIVGYGSTGVLSKCNNYGNVVASTHPNVAFNTRHFAYSGGIVGWSESEIEYCHNSGSISALGDGYYDGYRFDSNSCTGGIVGCCSANISYCSNNGSAITRSNVHNFPTVYNSISGGIVGQLNASENPIIKYCYNNAPIETGRDNEYAYVSSKSNAGGIVGVVVGSGISVIINSYNVGSILKAINRYEIALSSTNCYYLDTCGGNKGTAIAKTAEEMKSASFPSLLNASGEEVFFQDVNSVNDGYPILSWQVPEYSLQVLCDSAKGATTGSGAYRFGSEVHISVTPNKNYEFASWSDGVNTNPRLVTISSDTVFTALFTEAVQFVYAYYSDGRTIIYDSRQIDSIGYAQPNDFKIYYHDGVTDCFPAEKLDSISLVSPTRISEKCSADLYKQVTIGTQTWMAENYHCSKYDTESEAYKEGRYVVATSAEPVYTPYCTDATNKDNWSSSGYAKNLTDEQVAKLGYLYNWAAAMGYASASAAQAQTGKYSGNRQGICPNGWHLPSKDEWDTLYNYIYQAQSLSSNTVGKFLKSTSGWYNNSNGTDTYGFNALPAGYAVGSSFSDVGQYAHFLTSTAFSNILVYYRDLGCYSDYLYDLYYAGDKNFARSVRCVRD